MQFCCLCRNVETSCLNILPFFPAINKHHHLLPAKCHNLWDGGPTASYWQQLASSSVNSTHWSQILDQNRDFCLPHLHPTPSLGGSHRHIAMPWFGTEKLEWYGYLVVKIFWRYAYSFWQNVRMWQTDGHHM